MTFTISNNLAQQFLGFKDYAKAKNGLGILNVSKTESLSVLKFSENTFEHYEH